MHSGGVAALGPLPVLHRNPKRLADAARPGAFFLGMGTKSRETTYGGSTMPPRSAASISIFIANCQSSRADVLAGSAKI